MIEENLEEPVNLDKDSSLYIENFPRIISPLLILLVAKWVQIVPLKPILALIKKMLKGIIINIKIKVI